MTLASCSARRAPRLLVLAILLTAAGTARGQTVPPDASPAAPPAAQVATTPITVVGTRIQSPGLSASGTNDYTITSKNIADLPAGENTVMTDVIAQLPGVGIDQNQQVHIRNTEGSGFQYQINGVQVPFDINTNPPFISMINPLFISRLDLLDGILPARFSYSTGAALDIQTKDGCAQPGGSATLYGGMRDTFQPSIQYAGCDGALSYYGNLMYSQSALGFSSASPGPNAIHDATNQGQAFGVATYALNDTSTLSFITSTAASNNQLPNAPNVPPLYQLANAPNISPDQIDSYLNFRDYLDILSFKSTPTEQLTYQISYTIHSIEEQYLPDHAGELIYQGVATTATHRDFDNTLQGDVTYKSGAHTLSAGFYVGAYDVTSDSTSLVFPATPDGTQTSNVPVTVVNNDSALNILTGIYVNDLWQISPQFRLNLGLRRDELTGLSQGSQFNPDINLSYMPTSSTTLHAGVARYFQVPSFEGISPRAPNSFAGTTGEGPPGVTDPETESDWEYDAGLVQKLAPGITASLDAFYETTRHYLDAGQFGVVPVFAPFNYNRGEIWGTEIALDYKRGNLSAYSNITLGRNIETGVATGQYNFAEPGELAYIDSHYIILDHQPFLGITGGATYDFKPYKFSLDGVYNTGLRTGFANTLALPCVFQLNAGIERALSIGGHAFVNRLTLVNLLDRTNLIRPAGGLGVFQSAYGPRFTVFDGITVKF